MRKNIKALENEAITKLLLKISLPAIMGLVIQSLYNIIDTIYVGHAVGSMGIAAMTVVYPIQVILIGLSNLFSIGGGSLISIALGKKDGEEANKVAGSIMMFTLILSVILSLLAQIFKYPLCYLFGANDAVASLTIQYTTIMYPGIVVTMLLMTCYAFLRSEGLQKVMMISSVSSVVLNIILAPIFLWVFHWGMYGVSAATLISQCIALIMVVLYYNSGKPAIVFARKYCRIHWKYISRSFMIGSSNFLQLTGNSILSIMVNHFALFYGGSVGLAAYGLAYRIVVTLFMPILGFIQGGQPIIGYAYGQKNGPRVKEALNALYFYGIALAIIFSILSILFAGPIVSVFGDNSLLRSEAPYYLKALMLAMPLMSFQAISSSYFQFTGNILKSTLTTIFRQYICYIPIVFFISKWWGMQGFIYSYTVSNFISALFMLYWMQYEYRKVLKTGAHT